MNGLSAMRSRTQNQGAPNANVSRPPAGMYGSAVGYANGGLPRMVAPGRDGYGMAGSAPSTAPPLGPNYIGSATGRAGVADGNMTHAVANGYSPPPTQSQPEAQQFDPRDPNNAALAGYMGGQ